MSREHSPAAKPSLLNYSDLLQIWQDWMDTTPVQPLDRWLRQHGKQQRQQGSAWKMALNEAMNQALKYRQLADALEHSFRDPGYDNWPVWDKQWQAQQSTLASPQHFWFWIQLASNSDWRIPNSLSEQKARREHFLQFRQEALEGNDNALFMLWYGLRPGWEPLLAARARRSHWTDVELQRLIEQQVSRPPLWLRYPEGMDHSTLEAELNAEGVHMGHWQGRLYATGGKDITRTQAWEKGLLEVQDLASQQICELLDVQPGHKIWDACAGAGGKSLTLATSLKGKGTVTATDLHQYKLDELKRRAKRAQILNIRSFTWNAEAPLRLPAEIARQQGFDRILVDAPCSNTGTWRRNPDARWRLSAEATKELSSLQLQILSRAAAALRPNGRLVYATCSWQVAENEDVVNAFLKQNPQFELASSQMLGCPKTDSDSMFAAVLVRKSA